MKQCQPQLKQTVFNLIVQSYIVSWTLSILSVSRWADCVVLFTLSADERCLPTAVWTIVQFQSVKLLWVTPPWASQHARSIYGSRRTVPESSRDRGRPSSPALWPNAVRRSGADESRTDGDAVGCLWATTAPSTLPQPSTVHAIKTRPLSKWPSRSCLWGTITISVPWLSLLLYNLILLFYLYEYYFWHYGS